MLLSIQFLISVIISNIVSRKLDDYDYLGRFLLQFHGLIDVYWTFLAENQFLYGFNVFCCGHHMLCVPLLCLLSTELVASIFCMHNSSQSPDFVRKFSSEFPAKQPFSCLSALIKILSSIKSAMIFVYDDIIMM